MSGPEAALEVEGLKVSFRSREGPLRAVRGVSFSVAPGETLGIVGESGSGKSVTCLAAMGLLPETTEVSGSIKLGGKELLGLKERELQQVRGKHLAMIFQDPMTSLNPFLRVGVQLSEVLEVHEKASRRQARKRSIEMMERVGIADAPARVLHYPHQFSGGMRQRIMIAMALLCRPRVLIADEPTTALDVTIQAQILRLIRELAADFGTAVVFITHDLGVIAGIADTVSVMYGGRIVEQAETERLFSSPEHPYTQGLLQSVPRLHDDGALVAIPGHPPGLSAIPSGCAFHPRCPLAIEACRIQDSSPLTVVPGHLVRCPQARAFREESHPLAPKAAPLSPRAPVPALDTADLEKDVEVALRPLSGTDLASPTAVQRVDTPLEIKRPEKRVDPTAEYVSDDEVKEAKRVSHEDEKVNDKPAKGKSKKGKA